MVNAEADIAAVVNAAAMAAIREHLTKGEVEIQKTKTEHSDKGMDSKHKLTITFPHFKSALKKIRRRDNIEPATPVSVRPGITNNASLV
jgi:SpoVK/Ycf46/Vps4 family AAA+-type ATPase